MITLDELTRNKDRFEELIKSITIEGANIDGLIEYLENSDFFYAPATTTSHGSFDGGLCKHSLLVYDTLHKLVEQFSSEEETINDEVDEEGNVISSHTNIKLKYSEDTIKIVGLLHDLANVNYYETYYKNVKNEDTGKWEQIKSYKVLEPSLRNMYGTKAINSFMLISRFIPLTEEEIATIINFNCGMDDGFSNKDLYHILDRYSLPVLLHCADMISSHMLEQNDK